LGSLRDLEGLDMTEHSPIGASSIARLIACPGSYALSQQITTPSRTSFWAAQGTVAHKLAEEAITDPFNPTSELGTVIELDGHEITVDQEMVDSVEVYIEEVRRRSPGPTWMLEIKVVLDDYWTEDERPPVSAFGTADALTLRGDHLDVIDLKYGSGVYVPADSPQLFYYAAGALLRFEDPISTVDLVVVQPRGKGAAVRTHHTTALDVLIWVEEVLKPTVAAALSPYAPLATGKHCRFCPAQSQCPALHEIAQDVARRDFGQSPDQLYDVSDEELGDLLRNWEIAEPYIEALKERAIESIQGGGRIPGWTVKPTQARRVWNATESELAAVLPPIARNGLYVSKLRTPADAEKVFTPEIWDTLRPFVESRSSGFKLVQAADSRPSAAQEFDESVA
jgi:hypothetical protein